MDHLNAGGVRSPVYAAACDNETAVSQVCPNENKIREPWPMKRIKEKILILALFGLGISLLGCSTTIRETKATDTDPGNETQLKLDGKTVKVVHHF